MIVSIRPLVVPPSLPRPLAAVTPTESAAVDAVDVQTAAALATVCSSPAPGTSPTAALAVSAGAVPGPVGTCLRLIIAGPPGAGKTTHGTAIAKAFHVPEISTGNLLRAEMAAGTDIGRQIAPYMNRGDLVPIEFVEQVLEQRLRQTDAARGFVLDGLPRRLEDVALLDRLSEKLRIPDVPMLLLDVPDAEIVGRVANRRVCDNQHVVDVAAHPPHTPDVCDTDGLPLHRRPDDEPAVVAHRLEVYHVSTEPVIAQYAQRGLLQRVDGVGSLEAVGARALAVAQSLTISA